MSGRGIPAPPPEFHIRAYRPADREAVRRVFAETAFRSRGASLVFEDTDLLADYYTRAFTDFCPGRCLVAEKNGRVAATLLGVPDTREFNRIMAVRVVPEALARLTVRAARGRFPGRRGRRFIRWAATRAFREAPPVPLDAYPAHYHCNVLPFARQNRLYSAMARIFLTDCLDRGISRFHGLMTGPARGAGHDILFARYEKIRPGLVEHFSERPCTLFEAVVDDPRPMANRAYGFRIDRYLAFLAWMAEKYRI